MVSKVEIKKRMIATAAKSWGITVRDMQQVDPIVLLLLDACATEFEKLSLSINEAREIMGNKLMELVTPGALLNPYPARALIYAHPFTSRFRIRPEHQFYYSIANPFDEDDADIDIFFTPVANQILVDGEIKHMAANSSLHHFSEPLYGSVICKGDDGKNLPSNSLWLGLSLNKPLDSLDGVSICFEMEGVDEMEAKVFYEALASTMWEIDGAPVKTRVGFEDLKSSSRRKPVHVPLTEFNRSKTVSNHIVDFYNKKFISFIDNESNPTDYNKLRKPFPSLFADVFSEEDLDNIDGRFLWVRINFTRHIPKYLLNKVRCSTNCVAVINTREERTSISGRERIKELEAEEHELYFDLKNVSCDDEMDIIFEKQKNTDMEGKGLLTIRKDNIGRFNTRNALEAIQYLTDVFHEEYAAFSKIKGIDHEQIDDLTKAVRPFENIFEDLYQSSSSSMPFLMLTTGEENEDVNVDVRYWLTNGTLANGIKKGMPIRFDSAELVRDKISLLTTVMGGTDKKQANELINEFRYSLLTGDRIVTIEDIKAACYKQFGKHTQNVEVQKNVDADAGPTKGLRRIIDIRIQLKKTNKLSKVEVGYLKEDLEVLLKSRSMNVLPYKITVKV